MTTWLGRVANCAQRLSACVAADAWTVAEVAAWRVSLPVLKRTISVATLARIMWSAPATADDGGRREQLAVARRVLTTGGRLLVSKNCLERSLVLYRLLSRADANAVLVLGTAKDGSAIAGHAWVEVDGEPIGEAHAYKYSPIVAFGRGGQLTSGAQFSHAS